MGEPERITQSEYMQGGSPLHTMTGKLPYRQTHVSTSTISIFGGGLVALATGITWYQQKWYPDSTKGPFNFQQDIGYSKELDKFGHAFGGYMASYCSNEALSPPGSPRRMRRSGARPAVSSSRPSSRSRTASTRTTASTGRTKWRTWSA
jgi:hypothetical protein